MLIDEQYREILLRLTVTKAIAQYRSVIFTTPIAIPVRPEDYATLKS